jgi:oligoribonuclease
MNKPTYYLWIDLETTGLNPKEHEVIEIAAILTDPKMNPIFKYNTVVKPNGGALLAVTNMSSPAKAMHIKNNLIKELLSGDTKSYAEVQKDILALLAISTPAKSKIMFAGANVGFDKKFVEAKFPELARAMYHRVIDTHTIHETLVNTLGSDLKLSTGLTHRAMDDLLESMKNFTEYVKYVDKKKLPYSE